MATSIVPLGLTWVVVDGVPRRVGEFADLSPARRPRTICPECGRSLILKLGRIRRHHAAHRPHDRCIATRPETALHIELKFQLAAELKRGHPLTIRLTCAKENCDETETPEWLREWDEVLVEAQLGGRRPDVLLRHEGNDVGAIEVRVSHAVDATKVEAFVIPWIEVRGDEALLDWTVGHPLPVVRAGTFGPWRCERHALEAQTSTLRAARVVDVYHPTGLRDRFIYRIDEWKLDGRFARMTLRRDGHEIASAGSDWKPRLREAFQADVARLTTKPRVFADSPMRWATGMAAENLVHEAMSDMPPYDSTPLATRFPRRWFFARNREEWFQPSDTRGVRWDRAEYDAFAPHPAWAATRAAVRERPAASGAWNTFVFANRPTAEMFGQPASRITRDGPIAVVTLSDRRAIVVLTSGASDDVLARVAKPLDANGIEYLWVSSPRDWTGDRAHYFWAPAGRNPRGRGGVVLDGIGIYRAEDFATMFARGDRRVAPEVIRGCMAARLSSLLNKRSS